MKKTAVLILAIVLILFTAGFKRKSKPVIVLSSNPVIDGAQRIENNFPARSRIYIALYAENGFKYPGARLQISKQDNKTSNWGFSIVSAKDIYLDLSEKVYRDYIVLPKGGHYIIQFFYLNNKDYPFVHREFGVF